MRYVLDFGSANAGGAPAWVTFARLDTLAALPQPAFTEIGGGQYYFDVDWSTVSATSIAFKASLGGVELSDVIETPTSTVAGSTTAAAQSWSLSGYETVGSIINKAAIEVGLDSVSDPYASTDPNFIQFRQFLNSVGLEIAQEASAHLRREFSILTAGSATSYALPSDYVEMVPATGWSTSTLLGLRGPVTSQRAQYIKVWDGDTVVDIPFQIQGNRLTFPVAPGDGLTITGLYISRNWVQTAASGTGPDADHATASTDYVLFDPLLVVRGLKLAWLTAKGFDNVQALAAYQHRLEYVKATNASAPVLSLGGGPSNFRFIDNANLPDVVDGI